MNEKVRSGFEEKLKEYEQYPGMEELIAKLKRVPDSYIVFIAGVVVYTYRSPEGLSEVVDYLDTEGDLTTSDIIRFVSERPDFHDCCVGGKYENRKGASHE